MSDVSREEIAQYLELERERKSHQRQADTVERAAKPLKEKLKAYVEAKGGADRTCTHFGYILAMIAKGTNVSWKDEFVLVAGHLKAEQIAAEAPPKLVLNVEPVGAV